MILEERLGNMLLGGNNPAESFEVVFVRFPGEEGKTLAKEGGSLEYGSSPDNLDSAIRSDKLSKSPGDCSRRAPYNP